MTNLRAVNRLRILQFFLSLGLALILNETGFSTEKIVLEAGDATLLTIPSGSSVEINPKRVVEVEASGKGRIRVMAMRSGLALVKATSETGEKSYLVEVLSRDSAGDWLLRREWKAYFCDKAGVSCDLDAKVISGKTDDAAWFYEAKKVCASKKPCSFQVELSALAQGRLQMQLEELYPNIGLRVNGDGRVRIQRECHDADDRKNQQKEVIESLEKRFGAELELQCVVTTPNVWLFEVLVIGQRQGHGEISNPLRWEGLSIPTDEPIRAVISELSQNSRIRVVASPEFHLTLGSTATIKEGQEIQTLAIQKESEEILWKASGFRMELKLNEVLKNLARVAVRIGLSQPDAGLRTIDASEFASEVWVPEGKFVRIGRVEAKLEGNEEQSIPWLSAIPFLGRLFTWTSDTAAKSQVEIFLRIRPNVLFADSRDKVDWREKESDFLVPPIPAE